MPLARQLSNPGSNGSNVRWDVRGLQRLDDGSYTDGQYRYREDGLSYDRPDIHTPGLPAANENYAEWWARNPNGVPGSRQQEQAPAPAPNAPAAAPQEAATAAPARVLDADNPRAVEYALMRLSQLRALGIDYEELDDPTATWRHASESIAAQANERGFINPRDFLAGRQLPSGNAGPRRESGGPVMVRPRAVANSGRPLRESGQAAPLARKPVVRRPGVGRQRVI